MTYKSNKIKYLLEAKRLTQHVANRSFEMMGLKEGMKVLDVGCGLGQDVDTMTRRYKVNATGIDQDQEVLKYARENHVGAFHRANVMDLSYTPEAWDTIRTERVFQHLPEPKKALGAMYEALKVGGTLCVVDTVWNSVKLPRLRLLNRSHVALTRHALIKQYVDMTATKGLSDPITTMAGASGFNCVEFDIVEVRASNLEEANKLFDFEATLGKARDAGIIDDNALENALAQALIMDSKGEFFMTVQMNILTFTK